MNISVYHMLQSCGVQADFEILVPIFPNWTIINDLKYIHLPFEKSRHLEEFNVLVLLSNSLLFKEEIGQRSGFTR